MFSIPMSGVFQCRVEGGDMRRKDAQDAHTHVHIHMHAHVCVCVCAHSWSLTDPTVSHSSGGGTRTCHPGSLSEQCLRGLPSDAQPLPLCRHPGRTGPEQCPLPDCAVSVLLGLQLMGNAVFTFAQLLSPHLGAEASKTAVAMEKVKLRVLKVKPFFCLWEK